MIESLYIARSKIRQSLLALFFTNPSKRYYLREMQRMLRYSAGSIRRELLRFQKDGMFNIQQVGNLVYYSLNTKHPLFGELKSIVAKTVGVEGCLRSTLAKIDKIRVAFIYGSFATKRERAVSDIDLMIIGSPDTTQLNGRIAELEIKLNREINPTVYSPAEYREKRQASSGFLRDVLAKPKIMLIGGGDDL